MVVEGDWTMGSEHTIQYTDDVLYSWTLQLVYVINQCDLNKFNFLKMVVSIWGCIT